MDGVGLASMTAGVNCLFVQGSSGQVHAIRLHTAQDCTKGRREESTEFVPEALKNMLLVMAAQQVLTPGWQVSCPRCPAPMPRQAEDCACLAAAQRHTPN